MFKIQYKIRNDSFEEIDDMHEVHIRYYFLPATISFITASAVLHMPVDYIPLLDLAFNLSEITRLLSVGDNQHGSFEFTESDEIMSFDRRENNVRISLSFHEDMLETTFDEFSAGVRDFHQEISKYVRGRINDPIHNKALIKLLYPE